MKKKILSGLFWKFSESMAAQLVTFLVSIFLARMLMPEDYGAVALIMIFITIANVFVSSGFGSALVQKKDADNLDFSTVFFINIGISLIIYLILYVAAPYIAEFYNMPILSPTLRVLAIRIPISGINTVQHAYVSKNMLFKRFFWSTLFGTLLSGIVGITIAYLGFGIWALVAQYLTNVIVDTIVLWFTVKWRPMFKCSIERAKSLFSYGWKLLFSALLDTGYVQLRGLIIGKMYSSSDLAFYNQGDKFPSLIVTNINTSINSVLFPVMSESQDDLVKVKDITRKAIKVSSFVMWPMMVGLGVIAEPLISLILTDKWLPCVPYLRIFCFTYGLWPIHTSNLAAIQAIGRSDLFLNLEIKKKTMGVLVLLLVMNHGVMAIALSAIITSLISCYINASPNKKLLNYSYIEQMKDILPSFTLATIMGVIIYPVQYFVANDFIAIFIQIFIGVIIYVLGAYIVKFDILHFIIETVTVANKSRK